MAEDKENLDLKQKALNLEAEKNRLIQDGIYLAQQLGEIELSNSIKHEKNIDTLRYTVKGLREDYKLLHSDISYIPIAWAQTLSEVKKVNVGVSKATSALNKFMDISRNINLSQKDISSLSQKQIDKYKEQIKLEKANLVIAQALVNSKEEYKALANIINAELSGESTLLSDMEKSLEIQESRLRDINKIMGLTGATIAGIKTIFDKLGLGGLNNILNVEETLEKAKERAKELSETEIKVELGDLEKQKKELNNLIKKLETPVKIKGDYSKLIEQNKQSLLEVEKEISSLTSLSSKLKITPLSEEALERDKKLTELYQKQKDLKLEASKIVPREQSKDLEKQNKLNEDRVKKLNEAQESLNALSQKEEQLTNNLNKGLFSKQWEILKGTLGDLGKGLVKGLTDPLTISTFLISSLISAIKSVDKEVSEVAKEFGVSYQESIKIVDSMNNISNTSRDIYLTTANLVKAQLDINKALGTAAELQGELVKDYAKLTEQAGYTGEAALALSKITIATGGDLSDNAALFLGQVEALNATNKLAINGKKLMQDIGKISAATTLTLGMQPIKLAEAAYRARQLGLEISQIEKIASSLLDFESSISAQLEAELLTGRQLNLESARYYALQGDIGKAAEEIAKQIGTAEDFTNMNVIQQESLAKAVGMSRDELAQSLMEREALIKLGAKEGDLAKNYNDLLKQGLSHEEIAERMGNDKLASQMRSQSVQERLNQTTQKFQEIFVSLAEPILKVVEPLAQLATNILPLVNIVLLPIIEVVKVIGDGLSHIISLFDKGTESAWTWRNILSSVVTVALAIAGAVKLANKEKTKGIALSIRDKIIAQKKAFAEGAAATGPIFKSFAQIPFGIGIPLAIAAVSGLLAIISKWVNKGNDIISPGYGKRVLSAPEGTYALNDRDTIVAGTDLLGGDRNIQEKAEPITSPDITNNISINIDPLLNKVQIIIDILKQGISLPEIKIEIPKLDIPTFNISFDPVTNKLQEVIEAIKTSLILPKIELPETNLVNNIQVEAPKVEIPKLDQPKVDLVNNIQVEIPQINIPKFDIPEIKITIPELLLPETNISLDPILNKLGELIEVIKTSIILPEIILPETSIVNNIQVEVPKIEVPNIILPELNIPIPEILFNPIINTPELNIDLSSVIEKIQGIIEILNKGFNSLMGKNLDQQIIIPEQKPIINITNDFNPVIDKLSESNIFKPNIILPENIIEYPKFDFNVEPIVNKLQEGISIVEQILSREIQSEIISPQVNNLENTIIKQPTTNVINTIEPSIDFNPIVSSINELKKENTEMKEILKQLLNKDSNVYLDGNKIGISLTTGTSNYSIQ